MGVWVLRVSKPNRSFFPIDFHFTNCRKASRKMLLFIDNVNTKILIPHKHLLQNSKLVENSFYSEKTR